MKQIIDHLASELKIDEDKVKNVVDLIFTQSCTIPFVARYRKEQTGAIDEVTIKNIVNSYKYQTELIETKKRYLGIIQQYFLSNPDKAHLFSAIKEKIENCRVKQELDDLYLPFKPKRVSRAQKAKLKGLEVLLDKILETEGQPDTDLNSIVEIFLSKLDQDITQEEALDGASDIFAERVSENTQVRTLVRKLSFESGLISAEKNFESVDSLDDDQKKIVRKFETYLDYEEPILKIRSHRYMAVRRAESAKLIRLKVVVDETEIKESLEGFFFADKVYCDDIKSWLKISIKDSYKRLLSPSIETEIRLSLKNRAEKEAVGVFSQNLHKLLLAPPIKNSVVMGVDPGFRHGVKLAVIDNYGELLEFCTIFPDTTNLEHKKTVAAMEKIQTLIEKHHIDYIAVGNGTGGREVSGIIAQLLKRLELTNKVKRLTISESGASVYSTMEIAREEFPNIEPNIRSAISIARRLQDPLAELVKIEPRSIGVGQYQHDCNVSKLNEELGFVVASCVNEVGVEINTASAKLLENVSGVGPVLAKSIVRHRQENGPFKTKQDIKNVKGLGEKVFEQCAGFLRVAKSDNPLDNSAIHPERYELVEKVSKDISCSLEDMLGSSKIIDTIQWENFCTSEVGLPTLLDIARELSMPGRDPRLEGAKITYSKSLMSIKDLKIDMKLKGTVSNVTNFGAFVDLGIHQDGFIHVSELSDQFVSDPTTVVSIGDVVDVVVIGIDLIRKRISLSSKTQPVQDKQIPKSNKKQQSKPENLKRQPIRFKKDPSSITKSKEEGSYRPNRSTRTSRTKDKPLKKKITYSVGDLLSKFNSH